MLWIGNVLKPLAEIFLIPLGFTAAASATDAAIHEKMSGSAVKTLIISTEEMNDVMKVVKSPEKTGLLIKVISKTIKNGTKEQKEGIFGMLLDTWGASLFGNLFTSKDTFRAGEGTYRSGHNFSIPLANFEIQSIIKVNLNLMLLFQGKI